VKKNFRKKNKISFFLLEALAAFSSCPTNGNKQRAGFAKPFAVPTLQFDNVRVVLAPSVPTMREYAFDLGSMRK
jgi:hypothetical protein